MSDKKEFIIEASTRDIAGRAVRNLRRSGLIPAVLYGRNVAAKSLTVPANKFEKIYKEAGESTIVKLKIAGPAVGPELVEGVNVLIHDIQKHGTDESITHVDFYQVSMTEKLKAKVPLKFLGIAPAVKELGGTLVHPVSEVEVESLPADLPHEIEVDVSSLKTFEDVVRVSDLNVDKSKVHITANHDQVIVLVERPRTEAELKELEAAPATVDIATAVEGVADKKEEAAEGEEIKGQPTETKKA